MMKPAIWIDITSKNAAVSREFYARIFGWKIDVIEELNYGLTESPQGVPGGIGEAGDYTPHPAGIVAYFPVADLQAALAEAERAKSECVVQPWELPGYGRMAVILDPDGNRIGLWQR